MFPPISLDPCASVGKLCMGSDDTISLTRTTDLAFGEPGQMVTVPRQVGSVRLERQIGQGAMGVVWLGTDELLQRRVAVKFLLSVVQGPEDPRLLAFLEGARAAAAVRHSNLTNILHAATVENVPYLVMEYVDGPSLSALIRKSDPLTPAELLAVMTDTCNAVGHLHEQQRVHRDIKPSNVLIDAEGTAFVTDFGLSRELSARRGVLREGGAAVAGTPAYMAPEMFEGQISAKSDVYALGVTAFELLVGETPFHGSLEEIRSHHTADAPPIEKLLAKGASPALAEAVERALNKSPLFRHKTPAHLLAALEGPCGGSAMVPRGRQALFDRVLRSQNTASTAGAHGSGPAPEGAPPMTPGQTYYDRLTVIAEQKRREDSDLAVKATSEPARVEAPTVQEVSGPCPVLFGPQDPDYPVWPVVTGLIMTGAGALQAVVGPVAMIGLVARPRTNFLSQSPVPGAGASPLWMTLAWGGTAIAFFFGVLLIIAGIGFMMQRAWGVRLARRWGMSKLVFACLAGALVYAAAKRNAPPASTDESAAVVALAALAWEALLPLMLLAWLSTAAARKQTSMWK